MNTSSDLPRIGPYEIERKLGAGGMGTVYLGTHVETHKQAAVKVLSASLANEEGIVERFLREIDAMRQLSGPNIVELYESGSDDDTEQLYFAMEFVDGETLGDRLKRLRRLTWDQTVDIGLQICTALKAAHNAGIIHRDLKPSNLLLGNDGVVKLTDFGVAQLFATQRLTITGGVIGTAEYMSPEQTEGRRATKASDLYSLGAVLYVMLTGRPPFTGKTSLDILRKHQVARFDRPSLYVPDIPRVLEDVVCKLLEKKPEDRYGDAHIVSLRLKEVVKRVELAHREGEKEMGSYDLLAPTALPTSPESTAETTGFVRGSGLGHGHSVPSPATIMRDMFKAEIERTNRPSPIADFFNQTWVLLLCFALLILGGVWWFSNPREPISVTDPATADNEVGWILDVARGYQSIGQDVQEEQTLVALLNLVEAEPDTHADAIRQIKARLKILRIARDKQHNGFELAKKNLDRAKQLQSDGSAKQAAELARSIIVLYEHEPDAAKIVEAARAVLDEATAAPADSKDSSEEGSKD